MGDFCRPESDRSRWRSAAPGSFLVAFLDSTFLPLPASPILLLIVMVTRNPNAMPWYVVATVAGSLAGCLVMHAIGKEGGEALVRKTLRW